MPTTGQEDAALRCIRKLKRTPELESCVLRTNLIKSFTAFPATVAIFIVRFYQKAISPMLPATCRFQPTCSAYAVLAIQKYGLIIGGSKTIYRVLRCHPFCAGGHDPP